MRGRRASSRSRSRHCRRQLAGRARSGCRRRACPGTRACVRCAERRAVLVSGSQAQVGSSVGGLRGFCSVGRGGLHSSPGHHTQHCVAPGCTVRGRVPGVEPLTVAQRWGAVEVQGPRRVTMHALVLEAPRTLVARDSRCPRSARTTRCCGSKRAGCAAPITRSTPATVPRLRVRARPRVRRDRRTDRTGRGRGAWNVRAGDRVAVEVFLSCGACARVRRRARTVAASATGCATCTASCR